MHASSRRILLAALAGCLTAFLPVTAVAQAAKATTEKPSFDDLPSPEFGGTKNKSFKPKNWLEVEAKFNLAMRPEPKSGIAERVLVKWYVAVQDPERSGRYLLLTKDVNHVNVPLNEDVYTSVYLSPGSLRRLTGSDRAGKRAVHMVGFEILVNGEKVGQETSQGEAGWWNTASDRISRSETVPLLSKADTPFSNMWWDRYAEVETERR